MAVDGGRLGRATNPSDNYSSHNNFKYCSWGVPRKGLSPFFFARKEIQNLTGMVFINNVLLVYTCTVKGSVHYLWFQGGGGSVFFRAPL